MKSVTLTDPKSGESFSVQLYGTTPAILSQIIPILKEWKEPNHVFKQTYAFLKSVPLETIDKTLESLWNEQNVAEETRAQARPIIHKMVGDGIRNKSDEEYYAHALGIKNDPMVVLENFSLAIKLMGIVVKKESVPASIQMDEEFWTNYEEMDEVMQVANYFRNRIAEWTTGNK